MDKKNTSEDYIAYHNKLRILRMPVNHASIIFYLHTNKNAEQKDMKGPLQMSGNVICNAMRILIAQGYVEQTRIDNIGANRKQHNLTKYGKKAAEVLL